MQQLFRLTVPAILITHRLIQAVQSIVQVKVMEVTAGSLTLDLQQTLMPIVF